MSDIKERIEELLEELKEERDELKLKFKLAKMEASDEWEKIEIQLENLEEKSKELRDVAADASHDIGSAAKLLAEEIANGFKKIRNHL